MRNKLFFVQITHHFFADIYNEGFISNTFGSRMFVRLICCLSDLKESWSLWGLKQFSCPVCVCPEEDYNKSLEDVVPLPRTRPNFTLDRTIEDFEKLKTWHEKLAVANDVKHYNGHFVVRVHMFILLRNIY